MSGRYWGVAASILLAGIGVFTLVRADSSEKRTKNAPALALPRYAAIDMDLPGDHAALLEKLNAKVSVTFRETPLEAALAAMGKQVGAQFLLDEGALELLGLEPGEPVTLRLRDVELGEAIETVLRPLSLGVLLGDAGFVVTDEETAGEQTWTRAYPVPDLALVPTARGPRFLGRELVLVLADTVAPNSWNDFGGPGYVTYETMTFSLVATQSLAVHRQIERFLAMLRTSRGRLDSYSASVGRGLEPWSAVFTPEEELRGLFEEMVELEQGGNVGVVGGGFADAGKELLAEAARRLAAKSLAFAAEIERERALEEGEAEREAPSKWVRRTYSKERLDGAYRWIASRRRPARAEVRP